MTYINGRYVENKITLGEHLSKLDQNRTVNKLETNHLIPKIQKLFLRCGFPKAARNRDLIKRYITMIFLTQDAKCSYWIKTEEDEINGVWNSPGSQYKNWHSDWIRYELDHVEPANSGGKDSLTNIQFLSPNNNRFIKCALTVDQLLKRVDLSKAFKDRVRYVQQKREELISSECWEKFMNDVKNT
jgi:hypothetical protein